MTTRIFSELGISPDLLKAIARMGFEQASPIQAEAIPVLMQGSDAVGQSQTGSGKTAAFGIPAIEKVDARQHAVQILVLCPTRELAVQVSEEIHKLSLFKRGVHALPIYGGQSYDRQIQGLRQGAQIVIGTPGRVMDHMRRGTLQLGNVRMVVLDEADVMLDMGFREDIEFILQAVPKERQTVFFSATMPRPIQDLIQRYSRDPKHLQIEQKTVTVSTTEQIYFEVDRRFKMELLTRLIDIHDLKLGIIFCNTKRMVDDLADYLNMAGYSADRLHGDMTQNMRDRVMNKFRKSGLEFLVATDVAARGIDVNDVQVVFNYDLPYDVEDYVHRIGRTGRAGRSGLAVSFVAGRELFQIQHIERYTRNRIQRARIPTLEEVEEARASVFLEKVRATLQSGEYKRQDRLIERLMEEGFTSTDIASALIHHLQTPEGAAAPASQESRPDREDRRPSRDDRGYQDDRGFREERGYRDQRGFREERGFRDERGYRDDRGFRDDRPRREERGPRISAARSERPAVREQVSRPAASKPSEPVQAAPAHVSAPVSTPAPAAAVQPKPEAVVPAAAQTETKPVTTKTAKKLDARPAADVPAPKSAPAVAKPKASRRTPEGQTRLYINVGQEMGVGPTDVIEAIQGQTGLPAKNVGTVDLRERHMFVDVVAEHANAIISKLNRAQIKGHKLKVKVA